ncbi:unnamed protein product, partial [marine sediment metagenome]
LLFFNEIYKKILNVHGVIMEFGVYWGRDLALLQNLRGLYEPSNFTRKIIGFDTFEGIKGFDNEKDGLKGYNGDFATTKDYEIYLEKILEYHEKECYLPHIKKFKLIKGDVRETLPKYLEENPETIIAFAYFDMDIYDPTKIVLENIKSHLVKGSIIVFDEINYDRFPGETTAVKEVFGLNNIKLQRIAHEPVPSYFIFGD